MAKKSFSEKWKEKRVEFIPLDWRTSLTLDDGAHVCVCVCVVDVRGHVDVCYLARPQIILITTGCPQVPGSHEKDTNCVPNGASWKPWGLGA